MSPMRIGSAAVAGQTSPSETAAAKPAARMRTMSDLPEASRRRRYAHGEHNAGNGAAPSFGGAFLPVLPGPVCRARGRLGAKLSLYLLPRTERTARARQEIGRAHV